MRFLEVEVLTLTKKTSKSNGEPRIPQKDLAEDNQFLENEVVTPKLNDTEKGEAILERNSSQINTSTETHNETVTEKLFETPSCGSLRESITTNTNRKS